MTAIRLEGKLSHYQVLSLSADLVGGKVDKRTLKKAYHRALLQSHPDKGTARGSKADGLSGDKGLSAGGQEGETTRTTVSVSAPTTKHGIYTLDQIRSAYSTLSNDELKSRYDKWLRNANLHQTHMTTLAALTPPEDWLPAGTETVDLDDMEYRSASGTFVRKCRCGATEGFTLEERQLESLEEEMQAEFRSAMYFFGPLRSLVLGCSQCSLFIEVEWEVLDSQS